MNSTILDLFSGFIDFIVVPTFTVLTDMMERIVTPLIDEASHSGLAGFRRSRWEWIALWETKRFISDYAPQSGVTKHTGLRWKWVDLNHGERLFLPRRRSVKPFGGVIKMQQLFCNPSVTNRWKESSGTSLPWGINFFFFFFLPVEMSPPSIRHGYQAWN